jgi:cyclic pyranopterin phosphate synthase
MCHPLNLTSVKVDLVPTHSPPSIEIEATVKVTGQTGVEMEALTAVSAAGLTIYDMCKAMDREMVIGDIRLMEKSGGKSGIFARSNGEPKTSPVERPAPSAKRQKSEVRDEDSEL